MTGVAFAIAAILVACAAPVRADDSEASVPTSAEREASAQLERIAETFARSSDLRLRIAYSMTSGIEAERRPEDNGFYGVERVTAATLYADARGSTDPLVLDLLVTRCGYATKTMKACDRPDLATRWAAVDAQNQVAWLTLASVRRENGDEAGARAAFLRAADAPRWHAQAFDLAGVVARAAPASLPATMDNAYLAEALSKGYLVLPMAALRVLNAYCREDGELRRACARIVDVLVRDADSLLELSLAPRLAALARVDPLIVAGYWEQSDAMSWVLRHVDPALEVVDETDPDRRRRDGEQLRALIALGERRRTDEILLSRGITRSAAAARYVATLAPGVLKRRADAR